MKLMFNEAEGQQLISRLDCAACVFHHLKWCTDIDQANPLFRGCGNEIYIETSLDIFDL